MTAYTYTEMATRTAGGVDINYVGINGLERSSDLSWEDWPLGSGLDVYHVRDGRD